MFDLFSNHCVSYLATPVHFPPVFLPWPGPGRCCTLGGFFKSLKGRRSVILGVWATPGYTLPNGGGRSPPLFARVSWAPGAAQTFNMTDFRSLNVAGPPGRLQLVRSYLFTKCALLAGGPAGGPPSYVSLIVFPRPPL